MRLSMIALESLLGENLSPLVSFRNEYTETAEERMQNIFDKMQAIQNRATNQKRKLTPEETAEIKRLDGEFIVAKADFELEAMNSRPMGRRTEPGGIGVHGLSTRAAARPGVTFDSVLRHSQIQDVASGRVKHSGEIPMPGLLETLNELPLTSETPDSPPMSEQYLVAPVRRDRFANDPRLRFSLLRMLPTIPMTLGNELEFPRLEDDEDGELREAEYQGTEGASKKESSFASQMVSFYINTIAHWKRVSKQVLSDVPLLRGQLTSLLTYGVLKKLERELVTGDGVGRRIRGLATAATAFTGTKTGVDAIGECAATLATAGWNPDLVVLHPLDYFGFASERAEAGDGQYVAGGGWAAPAETGVWGLSKALTPFLTQGTALVLDSSQVSILDRMNATLVVEQGGHENTIKNLVTLLAELRAGLAIFSPAAIRSVDVSGGE